MCQQRWARYFVNGTVFWYKLLYPLIVYEREGGKVIEFRAVLDLVQLRVLGGWPALGQRLGVC